jgi:potassium-transporting ATPase KdpC subunit
MLREIRLALVLFALLTLLTGVAYPLLVTGIAQGAMPWRANGSLIQTPAGVRGSELLGQCFATSRYFRGRPSATSPQPCNGGASSGSNAGPTNPAFLDTVKGRIAELRALDPADERPVPVELVTASGSGLDPHISPAAAAWQVPRVARARGLSEDRVRELVAANTQGRTFGLLGEPRVHVLRLNLALDHLESATAP